MVRKNYIEVFDIDQEDTRIMNDISNREFTLAEIKKKYDKTRVDRLLRGLKEMEVLIEVGKTKNKIGRGMKIFKIKFPEQKLYHSGKRQRFFKVQKTPLFK